MKLVKILALIFVYSIGAYADVPLLSERCSILLATLVKCKESGKLVVVIKDSAQVYNADHLVQLASFSPLSMWKEGDNIVAIIDSKWKRDASDNIAKLDSNSDIRIFSFEKDGKFLSPVSKKRVKWEEFKKETEAFIGQ